MCTFIIRLETAVIFNQIKGEILPCAYNSGRNNNRNFLDHQRLGELKCIETKPLNAYFMGLGNGRNMALDSKCLSGKENMVGKYNHILIFGFVKSYTNEQIGPDPR